MIMRVWYQTWCIQAIKQNANERSRRRRNNKKTVTKKLLELFDFAISHFTCICDYCSTHSQVFVGYINIIVAVSVSVALVCWLHLCRYENVRSSQLLYRCCVCQLGFRIRIISSSKPNCWCVFELTGRCAYTAPHNEENKLNK